MNRIKYLILAFFLVIVSCSKDDGSCPCIKQSTSGTSMFDSEVDSGFCTGELENPSPQSIYYSRICDY